MSAVKTTDDPQGNAAGVRRRRRFVTWGGGVLLVFVLSALGAGAYLNFQGGAGELGRAARRAVAARQFDTAKPLLDRWIAARPDDGEPYALRAKIAVAEQRPQDAFEDVDKALVRKYDPIAVASTQAVLLARAGRVDEAEPILHRAFRSEPFDPEVAEALARVYLARFRLTKAAPVLDRWMREAPDDPRPYLYRNEIDQRSDAQADVLIANYRQALQRDPNLDKARLGLADQLRESQRVDEAEVEYAAYLTRNPKSVEGHLGAGAVSLRKGNLEGAVRHFSEALATDPKEPVALRELALIDMRKGEWARARDRLKEVIEIDQFDPEVHVSYARTLRMTGDESGAKREDDLVLKLRREHSEMRDIQSALIRTPKDVPLRLKAARWLLEHGHDAEGLEWTQILLKEHPGHPETCRLLEDYYRQKGNIGLANYYKNAAGPGG